MIRKSGCRPRPSASLGPEAGASESELRLILNSVPALIARFDRDARFQFVNRAHAEFLECAPAQLIGRRVEEILDPEACAVVLPYVRRALAGERASFERRHRRRDGSLRWLALNYIPAVSVDGEVTGFFGLHVDITEQKRAQDELRASEARFRELSELSSDWFWEQDAQYRFVSVGARSGDKAPIRPPDFLGKRPWETPGTSPSEAEWTAFRARLDARLPYRDFQYSRLSADGRIRSVGVSGKPVFGADGRFLGYRGVGSDITERKAEERLLAMEHAVTRCLAGTDSVSSVLSDVLREICESQRWDCGRYFEHDEASGVMRFTDCWSVSDPAFERLLQESRGLEYARGTGLVGRAWESGEAQWTGDAPGDPRLALRALSRDTGIRGVLVLPVVFEGRTFGVLSIASRTMQAPDERLLKSMRVISSQIGQFLARRRAEGELRESEARFKALTELSSDWFWEQDAELRFTRVSGSLEAAAGRDPARVVGKRRWELAGQSPDPAVAAAHEADLEARRPFSDLEYKYLDDSGRTRWCSISGEPVFGPAAVFKGYRGIGRDITKRRREEQLLRLEHEVSRVLSEANDTTGGVLGVIRAVCLAEDWPCGRFFRLDDDTLRLQEAWCVPGSGFERFADLSCPLTYRAGEGLAGTVLRDAVPVWTADVRTDPRARDRSLAEGASIRGVVALPVMCEAHIVGVLTFSSATVRAPDERLLQAARVIGGQLGLFVQRSQAEAALAQSEARFRALTQLSSDWFWEQDAECRFTKLEGFIVEKFGIEKREVLGRRRWELPFYAPLSESWDEHRRRLGAHQPFRDFEMARIDESGNILNVALLSGEPMFDAGGCFVGYRGVGRDVTGRRAAEEQVRKLNLELEHRVAERTEALSAANRELESFSYSVSHDLRAPLRAIDGFSRLLKEECAGQISGEGERLLGRICANVAKMAQLIDGLLQFARLSRTPVTRSQLDPAQVVREVLEDLAAQRTGRDVEIVLGPLPACLADRLLLKQVYTNLIGNALKYTAKRSAARIEIGAREDAGAPVYFVRDNGAGFDMKYAGKLFGVFERLHSPAEFDGTGIGLATVQRIVARHGGRVWADAAPEAGAAFYFTLPGLASQ